MPVKCVLSFKQGSSGWTETYYNDSTTLEGFIGTLATRFQAVSAFDTLVVQRSALLVQSAAIIHARVTLLSTGGTLPYDVPAAQGQGLQKDTAAGKHQGAAEVWTSLMTNLFSGTLRPRRLYLGGVPDRVILPPQSYQPDNAFSGAMTNFIAVLVGGHYIWPTRPKVGVNDKLIQTFTVNADGRTANMTPIVSPAPDALTWYVLLRGLKAPRGWNGVHRAMKSVDGLSMVIGPTKRAQVSDPPFAINPGQFVVVFAPTPAVIDAVDVVKPVNKKRGRPFGLLRGRR